MQQELQRQEMQRQQQHLAKQREQEHGQRTPTPQREGPLPQRPPSSGKSNLDLRQPPVSSVGPHRGPYSIVETRAGPADTKPSQGPPTVDPRYVQNRSHPGQSYPIDPRTGQSSAFGAPPVSGEIPQGVPSHLYAPADMRIHQSAVPYPIRMPHLPVDMIYQQQHAQYMAAKERGLIPGVPPHYIVEHPGHVEHPHLVDGRPPSQGTSRPPSRGSQHGGSLTPSTTHSPFSTPEPHMTQPALVAAHTMAEIPPADGSLLSLLQVCQHPIYHLHIH